MWDTVLLIVITFLATLLIKKLSNTDSKHGNHDLKIGVYYACCLLEAAVVWPFFLLRPKNVRNCTVAAQIIKHVTKVIEVKWHLRNGKVLAEDRGAVIVSNHQSSIDILGMFNIWHVMDKVAAVARKELFYIWPFGLSAYLAGVVFIDRSNPKDAYRQLQVTSEVMIKNKTKLWLFPEGTRNKDFTKLLPFKKGAFNIAVAAQVPVLPVVYSPYYFINTRKNIFNKGHVIIQCLDPVPTTGMTMEDVPELIRRVRGAMETAYQELSKEVLSALPADYPLAVQN
ncbi:1-acyl-sn-glycerol-3-phosphate acyltransferase beta isoform X2 [Plutella xylostella]|uniref:1-acyl-sn-glycerol-3-phosphate acyltransferase beta isoform X2 n=1 Tax=Plutella xylostella TaxID=51655 RepID=UPI0005D0DE32|nr:1-acyl-sn-glycerol-3-phosphate acyltransferase beta isoform X2 [Plutella xylostella]